MIRVDLVIPPSLEGTVAASRSGCFQPLGLLSIATYARTKIRDVDIRIWDGNLGSEDELRIRPDAHIVGFSPTIMSYDAGLRLARRAKEAGSIVVFGGFHATALGQRVLDCNDWVDYVIQGDGECSFAELVKGTDAAMIPGLLYRGKDGVRQNARLRTNLNRYPFADRTLLDREAYLVRFRKKYARKGFRVADVLYSQKDCFWASKTGGCVFCGRIDRDYRARTVEHVWREILWLRDTYNTDYIWDVAGSFTGNTAWLRSFHQARPREHGVALEVYARASELVWPDVVGMLRDIGVHKVFIGAESGGRQELRRAKKGATPEMNIRAVRLCGDHGIALSLGFVVGLPGETEESSKRTVAHARRLVSLAEVETISCAVLLPLPGRVRLSCCSIIRLCA